MSDIKVVFRTPTSSSFLDCDIFLYLGLILYLVCVIPRSTKFPKNQQGNQAFILYKCANLVSLYVQHIEIIREH